MPSSCRTVEPSRTKFTGCSICGISEIPWRTDPTRDSLVISDASMSQGLITKVTCQGHIASLGAVEWVDTEDGRFRGIGTIVPWGTDGWHTCHRWAIVARSTVGLDGSSSGTFKSGPAWDALGVDGVVWTVVPCSTELTVGVGSRPCTVSHSASWTQDGVRSRQTVKARGTQIGGVISHSCFIAVVAWFTWKAVCLCLGSSDVAVPESGALRGAITLQTVVPNGAGLRVKGAS